MVTLAKNNRLLRSQNLKTDLHSKNAVNLILCDSPIIGRIIRADKLNTATGRR